MSKPCYQRPIPRQNLPVPEVAAATQTPENHLQSPGAREKMDQIPSGKLT